METTAPIPPEKVGAAVKNSDSSPLRPAGMPKPPKTKRIEIGSNVRFIRLKHPKLTGGASGLERDTQRWTLLLRSFEISAQMGL
ncbi:hypothetical protein XI08_19525 [Bradyrhizobium sp. CCBAU 11361]|nr:hypothetical protein [Bradyrhizobium sp. CCBAU 11361]